MKPTLIETTRAAWGVPLPDWIETLAVACMATSQNKVARDLGRSAPVISQVLAKKYPASTSHIEERVRGVFMNGCVACPGLGDLPMQDCQDWRLKARRLEVGNPLRTRMFRACNLCPRFQPETEEAQ